MPVNMALIKGFDLVGVRMGAQMMMQPHLYFEMTQKLIQLAHDSKLAPYVSAEFPMSQAKEAFKVLAERRAIGKVCITFNDTKSKL